VSRLQLREAAVAPARGSRMTPEQAGLILRGDRSAADLATGTIVTSRAALLRAQPAGGARGTAGEAGAAGGVGVTAEARDSAAGEGDPPPGGGGAGGGAALLVRDRVRPRGRGARPGAAPGPEGLHPVSDGFLDGSGTRDERAVDLRA
jgi:hypothetical protein